MTGKRLLYLTVLGGCCVFYIAYGQWLAWILLLTVLGLPWFSLFLSMPAIVRFRAAPSGPDYMNVGETAELWLMGSSRFPVPPFRGKLKLKNCITGKQWYYQEPGDFSTDHCGGFVVTAESIRVCDYLGLFSIPIRRSAQKIIPVRPLPVAMEQEQLSVAGCFCPGSGSYTEENELRSYHPGDCLNRIHWKLSAKTENLIIRDPVQPHPGSVLVTMNHRGTGGEIDRKLGRLLWLGHYLLDQGTCFEIRALSDDGILTFSVSCEQELQKTVDTLLCSRSAETGDLRDRQFCAVWHWHIGGEPDEV